MAFKVKKFLNIYFYVFCGIFFLGSINRVVDYFSDPELQLGSTRTLLIIGVLVISLAAFGYFGVWLGLKRKMRRELFVNEFKFDRKKITKKYEDCNNRLKDMILKSYTITSCHSCSSNEFVLIGVSDSGTLDVECKICVKEYQFNAINQNTNEICSLFNDITDERLRINSYSTKKYGKGRVMIDDYGLVLRC